MKRRNISGVYIFEQFEGEDRREPTCFEDCTEATQDRWLESLDADGLRNLAKILGRTIIDLSDYAGIVKQ